MISHTPNSGYMAGIGWRDSAKHSWHLSERISGEMSSQNYHKYGALVAASDFIQEAAEQGSLRCNKAGGRSGMSGSSRNRERMRKGRQRRHTQD